MLLVSRISTEYPAWLAAPASGGSLPVTVAFDDRTVATKPWHTDCVHTDCVNDSSSGIDRGAMATGTAADATSPDSSREFSSLWVVYRVNTRNVLAVDAPVD